MNEKQRKILVVGVCVAIVAISSAVGWAGGWYYRDRQAAADNRNVLRTIQQMEDGINRLGCQLADAQEELRRGQGANSQAGAVTEDLGRSNEQSQYIIDDSQQRVSELKRQLADVERANGITPTDE